MDRREKQEKLRRELLQKEKKKINTTLELAQIIRAIVPKTFKRILPQEPLSN